jgi:hypothetical protein
MRIYEKGKKSPLFNDLTEKRFGSLVAKEYVWYVNKYGKAQFVWKCVCDCGEVCSIRSTDLSKEKRIDCKKCSKSRQAKKQTLPDELAKLKRVFRHYKKHAENKKRAFNISFVAFRDIICQKCVYCGEPPKKYKDEYERNGIDRIDSKKGYVIGNVVSCCETCNRAKLDNAQKDFFEWVNKVYNHLKENKNI